MEVFQLVVTSSKKNLPQPLILQTLRESLGESIDALTPFLNGRCTAWVNSAEIQKKFHRQNLDFKKGTLKLEAYPPPKSEAPHWKEPPTVISTRMRVLRAPMNVPLDQFEAALGQYEEYIKGSVWFEIHKEIGMGT